MTSLHVRRLDAELGILRKAGDRRLQVLVVDIGEVGVLDECDQFLAVEHERPSIGGSKGRRL